MAALQVRVARLGLVLAVILGLAALVGRGFLTSAQASQGCTNAGVAGAWGYTETGTVYLPSGAVPYASVGSYTLDADGNLSGARTNNAGGAVQKATIKGTATVNSDCTGTETLSFYDDAGNVLNTAVKALVYVDNAREVRKIVTAAARSGTEVQAVLTTDAKKLLPDRGNQQ
jgi:hypothetical protein